MSFRDIPENPYIYGAVGTDTPYVVEMNIYEYG